MFLSDVLLNKCGCVYGCEERPPGGPGPPASVPPYITRCPSTQASGFVGGQRGTKRVVPHPRQAHKWYVGNPPVKSQMNWAFPGDFLVESRYHRLMTKWMNKRHRLADINPIDVFFFVVIIGLVGVAIGGLVWAIVA